MSNNLKLITTETFGDLSCNLYRNMKDECFPMDAIEHDNKLRDALTLLIDNSLIKYGLKTEEKIKNFKREILFDREPVEKKK